MTDDPWVAEKFPDGFPFETVTTLLDSVDGVFLVTTSDAIDLLDLDSMLIQRSRRLDADHPVAHLRLDDEWIRLVRLIDCTVGYQLEVVVDLGLPGGSHTHRRSTDVRMIAQILQGRN